MIDEKLIFVLEADTSAYDAKLSKAAKAFLDMKADERDAYLKESGLLQKIKLETELLTKARQRANDPASVIQYSERIRALNADVKNLTGALQPKQTTIFDSIKSGLGLGTGFSLVQGIQRAVSVLMQLGKEMLSVASDAEETRTAFETMLQSKDKATKLQGQIVELASKTPFELTDLNNYTKRLLAMGIEQEKVIEDMKTLGDISAGVGKEKLPQLVLAFGQVKTAGKLAGGEARQFAEAGVGIFEALAQQTGRSMSQIKQDVEDGKIKFQQVRDALRSMTSENGRFFNLMEKQSATLSGMVSNLSDAWTQLEVVLGQKFMGAAKGVVSMFTSLTNAAKKFLEVPMSEKLEEERIRLNSLVSVALSLNDNYAARAAVIREIKAEYPDFLKGLDMETVKNEQLIQRLKEVNNLYSKRIALEVAKEKEAGLQEKVTGFDKKQEQDRQKALEMLTKAMARQGKTFDVEGYYKATNKQDFIETSLEQAGRMMQGDIKFILNNAAGGNIGNSKYNKDLQAATKSRVLIEKDYQNEELKAQKLAVDRAKQDIETAKKERDRFTEGSEEFKYYNDIATRQEAEYKKLRIEYAKASIEDIDKQIQEQTSILGLQKGGLNEAIIKGTDRTQIDKDLSVTRGNLASLAKRRGEFQSMLPKEDTTDPKAAAKALKTEETLAEKRIKAREDLAKKLAQINAEIAKMGEVDGMQTVERIKKRYEAQTAAELESLKKQKEDLIRSKVFTRKEADKEFLGVETATKKKELLAQQIDTKKFKEEALKAQRENEKQINDLILDASKERLEIILNSLEKENQLIARSYEDDKRAISEKYAKIREALKQDYDKGFLSIAATDKVALTQAKEAFEKNLSRLTDLENDALEIARQKRDAKLLELNYKSLQEAQKTNESLFTTFERGTSEAETAEIKRETEKYIRKQLTYEKFQKSLSEIQKRYELQRANTEVTRLNDAITTIEKAMPNLNANDQKDSADEVERLKIQLEAAKQKVLDLQAGARTNEDNRRKERLTKYLNDYEAITNAALNAFQTIESAEINYLNRSIDAQQKRIDRAKDLRDKGNTEYLQEEEKRTAILEEKRRKALARQQFIDRLAQLSAVSVGVARAFAESGGKLTAVSLAASISALVAAYSLVNTIVPNVQRFAKGTKYVTRPNGVPQGTDTVPALLTEGERVTDARTNKEYGASFDVLQEKRISPKEAFKRLTAAQTDTERLARANTLSVQEKADRIELERLQKKQVEQNEEIIRLLKVGRNSVNVNMDKKGFSLAVLEGATRETKRTN